MLLVLRAFLELLLLEIDLERKDFASLYDKVRSCSTRTAPSTVSLGELCFAIDKACIWYPKTVLCLQRSAATTRYLRKHGISAQLVIGAQQFPFRAHAWVEFEGRVINDKPYMQEMYAVLDRC